MNYLTVENITKSFGDNVLFEDITFHIDKGQKVAFIAKNGSGKSTLLKIIAGQESKDGDLGQVLVHKAVKVGYLNQSPTFPDEQTVMEAVFDSQNPMLQAIKEYEWAMLTPHNQKQLQAALAKMDDLKAWDFEVVVKQILTKLHAVDYDRKMGTLSGGQQKRIALAKVLIDDPDFLILDEPTNHLDLDMIEWLENYLSKTNKTLLMVTHDRYFLERVCNLIIELDNGVIYKYPGNYSAYLNAKAMREEIELNTIDRAKRMMREELKWIRRQPKARGTKAKARVDAFHDLKEVATQKVDNRELIFEIKYQRLGKRIVEFHNVSKSFGDLKILDKFDYKFRKNEKVGIVGRNGTGKSTFLELIMNRLQPDSGRIKIGETVKLGYYSQDGIKLKEDQRVLDVIKNIAPFIELTNGKKLYASEFLERFLFPKSQQHTYVSRLSGGERRRLYLMTVLMQNPNFLILDEPTNDLDILTLNVLEQFLFEFQGCLVIVSHDRYFMDKLVEHIFVFDGNGNIKDYNGNYTKYRAIKLEEEREERRLEREEKNRLKAIEEANKPKEEEVKKLTYQERKEFNRLEKEIDKLEQKKTEITEKFSDTSLSGQQIEELSIKLAEVEKAIEEKEERWMELAEYA